MTQPDDTFGMDGPAFMSVEEVKDGLEQLSALLASHIGVNEASDWIMELSGDVLDLEFVKERVQ